MIHVYSLNAYYIGIDSNSGSVHILDPISYDILKDLNEMPSVDDLVNCFGDKYSIEEITDVYEDVKALNENGMLFTELNVLEKVVRTKLINKSVKALCLHVAHDCNLRCKYCFAAEGDYNSGRKLMDLDVAKQAVDYLVNHSKGRRKIEIDFFGGEPLMNFEVVKEVVLYGKELEKSIDKRFYFTITTNGVLLDQNKIAFINEYIDNIVISIDGRKEVHDAVRYDRAGGGSYKRIVPLAKELISNRNGKSYFIRGTFTAQNMDFAKDVMHLADLGFKEISVEPVVGSGSELHFRSEDIPALLNEYENLAIQYTDRLSRNEDFNFYHFTINVFDGPCIYKKITACGAGSEYLAVSPEGNIYPCHQFVGEPEFLMGDVYTGINKEQIGEAFLENTILAKEACRDCWAKLFCSGGCHANSFFSNGSIKIPNELSCTLQKKRIECAIMIQAWKADHGKLSQSAVK